MCWLILILSGALEAVWARALAASNGFRRPLPVVVFLLGLCLSLGGLSWALQGISVGTAYAVWVGVGASLTVIWGIVRGEESVSVARVLLLLLLIVSVIGLKVVS